MNSGYLSCHSVPAAGPWVPAGNGTDHLGGGGDGVSFPVLSAWCLRRKRLCANIPTDPYLTLAEVHSALAYYFDHREEIEAELAAEYREVEQWKQSHPPAAFLLRLKAHAKTSS